MMKKKFLVQFEGEVMDFDVVYFSPQDFFNPLIPE